MGRTFIKDHMSTNNDFLIGRIIAFIATMIIRIAQEDTRSGAGLEFIDSGGRIKRKAKTPKDPNMRIGRFFIVEDLKWRLIGNHLAWKNI